MAVTIRQCNKPTKEQLAASVILTGASALRMMRAERRQMGYIGWDVAITKDGPLFIEANNMPGHDAFPQMPLQAPDKIGILPVFQKYIKGL